MNALHVVAVFAGCILLLIALWIGQLLGKLSKALVGSGIVITVIITALLLFGLEYIEHIEIGPIEFTRQVATARETIDRLQAVETTARETIDRIESNTATLIAQEKRAKETTNALSKLAEQQEKGLAIDALRKKAIIDGDRNALRALMDYESEDDTLNTRAQSAHWDVIQAVLTTRRFGGPLRNVKTGEVVDISQESTGFLIDALFNMDAAEYVRGKAAMALSNRKEQGVPEALLKALEAETIWVAREALQSFRQVTGYDEINVLAFMGSHPRTWYEANKEEIGKTLKPIDENV